MATKSASLEEPSSSEPLPAVPEERQPGPSASTARTQARKPQSSIGACDACRLRKVRCLANESSMSSKCQRCTRANRECIYTTHSKTRRRKRTDTRVKELEEKVRGLSLLLEHRNSSSTHSSAERDIVESLERDGDDGNQSSDDFGSATAEGFSPFAKPLANIPSQVQTKDSDSASQPYRQSRGASLGQISEVSELPVYIPDVVDRGILNMDKAEELYKRYVNELAPLYPAVVFPSDYTTAEFRKNKPILFLAVIAASAGSSSPALNLILNKEIQQTYATKVSIQGRKSIEIVQALLISILWTYPPDKFEDLKFHQQVTQAATMALDLGLAQKPRASANHSAPYQVYDSAVLDPAQAREEKAVRPVMHSEKSSLDSSTLECRRTLLACYVFCASASMSLRLPNMLRFSNWMTNCVESLEQSPDAAPTDKRFVSWVKMQRIVEECGTALALDDPSENVSLADERIQATVRGCEKQLDAWKRNALADKETMNSFLEITYYANNIYLHEIALHPDHDAEDFRPPFFIAVKLPSTQSNTALTPPYINAIIQCISSADSLIRTFLAMNISDILRCPTLVYVRVVYASVVLIKLSISASMPSSELGKLLDPENNKIETYLEQLLVHLKEVASLDNGAKHVISYKFLGILTKLKHWCQHQKLQSNEGGQSGGEFKQENDKIVALHTAPELCPTTLPALDYGPLQGVSRSGSALQNYYPSMQYTPLSTGRGGFFNSLGKSPTGAAVDLRGTPSMPATPWANNYQQPVTTYAELQNSFPYASDDNSMEVDPNLFTHLVDAQLDQNNQDAWTPDGTSYDGMDYSNFPEFNWATWPQQ